MPTIYLSPSTQEFNPYNGGGNEEYYMNLIADAMIPYLEASGEGWLPAGDPFSVYPAQNGDCLESLRLIAFKAGIDDMRALELCESLYDRDTVLDVIKEALGYSVGYESYVKTSKELISVREKINELIKAKISSKRK
jgi:hypothetical protein